MFSGRKWALVVMLVIPALGVWREKGQKKRKLTLRKSSCVATHRRTWCLGAEEGSEPSQSSFTVLSTVLAAQVPPVALPSQSSGP